MVLDISPEPLGEVSDHLAFIDTAHGRPPLPLVVADPLLEPRRQAPLPHPPLYVPHLQLHCLFLGRCCMQKHLRTHPKEGKKKEKGSNTTIFIFFFLLFNYNIKSRKYYGYSKGDNVSVLGQWLDLRQTYWWEQKNKRSLSCESCETLLNE